MEPSIVLYPNDNQYCNYILSDLKGIENIAFYSNGFSGIFGRLKRIYISVKLNKKFRLPFQWIWYKGYTSFLKVDADRYYVFVFFQGTPLAFDPDYLQYIRNNYPKSLLVFYWLNISSKSSDNYRDYVNHNFDMVYNFDKNDSNKNGWNYYPTFFSQIKNEELLDIPQSDVFFVGSSKGRLDVIHSIYEKLSAKGIVCDFHVVNVPKKDAVFSGISYNKRLSYKEVLSHVKSCKFVLEILQEGQVGVTLRTFEAIALNKFLLTNNQTLKESTYSGDYILFFKDVDDIPILIQQIGHNMQINKKDEELIKMISPVNFIEQLIKDVKNIKY